MFVFNGNVYKTRDLGPNTIKGTNKNYIGSYRTGTGKLLILVCCCRARTSMLELAVRALISGRCGFVFWIVLEHTFPIKPESTETSSEDRESESRISCMTIYERNRPHARM